MAYYIYYNNIKESEKIYNIVKQVSSITHAHDISILGCYIYVRFVVEGIEDSQITLEMESGQEYVAIINGNETGSVKTNLGGKMSLSVELNPGESSSIKISKV